MNRKYTLSQKGLIVFGDTFPVRGHLKDLGARWVAASKTWSLPHTPEVVEGLISMGFTFDDGAGAPSLQKAKPSPFHTAAFPPQNAAQFVSDSELSESEFSVSELSVSELSRRLAATLHQNFPGTFWLIGEISHVQKSRGHTWLEIADASEASKDTFELNDSGSSIPEKLKKRASLAAVIWNGVLTRITRRIPENNLPLQLGLVVRVLVHLEYREEGGKVQVVIDDVDSNFTQGRLALSREQILADLRKRGLADLNKSTRLDALPLKIALITADKSRARNDFLHELERSPFSFLVTLFDSRMQGESTSDDVCRALEEISQVLSAQPGNFSAVVITRGGGSRMDLRWFDALEIAKSIAYMKIPVITAIGHHEDQSIADAVAHTCEKTPTAAAQFLVQQVLFTLDTLNQRIRRSSERATRKIQSENARILELQRSVEMACTRRIDAARRVLEANERLLSIVEKHLLRSLERGFALVWKSSERSTLLRAEEVSTLKFPHKVCIEMRTQDGLKTLFLAATIDNKIEGHHAHE